VTLENIYFVFDDGVFASSLLVAIVNYENFHFARKLLFSPARLSRTMSKPENRRKSSIGELNGVSDELVIFILTD